jgi:hypothetical protein
MCATVAHVFDCSGRLDEVGMGRLQSVEP